MPQEEFYQLAAERNKLIVESADSNDEPLIFDAPNELIVGNADIESDSGDASSDTSGAGGDLWGLRRGFSSDNMYLFNAYLRRTVICGTPKKNLHSHSVKKVL
jgi:hypothetical protein